MKRLYHRNIEALGLPVHHFLYRYKFSKSSQIKNDGTRRKVLSLEILMSNIKVLPFPAQLRNNRHDKNNMPLTLDLRGIKIHVC